MSKIQGADERKSDSLLSTLFKLSSSVFRLGGISFPAASVFVIVNPGSSVIPALGIWVVRDYDGRSQNQGGRH